ncbi:hypothetical protein GA0070622_1218 [Micromonospora sediminicola]|uniref:Uncharacterized protein n=1 Tax=Micromonospora sediminicola TaxID=946078 RepID=A0A1A9B571_9ACTN|nr:helix-turn-helix domain-containing protein [Micromonospora sediminicola]SBT64248.1 hypothetical protein GA0070622_1218 [Micromonospora sediminicola]
MTADVIALTEQSTEEMARARAERIRQGMRNWLETVSEYALAWERRDWHVLGYADWQAYLDGEFGAERLRMPTAQRQVAVEALRSAGMSQRAIGSALGVSVGTVNADLAVVQDRTPAEIRGADGKTYAATRPAPAVDVAPGPGPEPDEQVWIAAARRAIEAHALKSKTSTRCSRSTRTGLTLPARQATEKHAATWCRKCWPEPEPSEVPCGRCGTVVPAAEVADGPGGPPTLSARWWCAVCRFMPPADYVTTSVTYGTLLPGDYIDRPYGPRQHVAWHQVVQAHFDAGVTVFTNHSENVPVHEDVAGDLPLTVRRPEGRTAAAGRVSDCRACHSLVPAAVIYNGKCPACLDAADHAQMSNEKLLAQSPDMEPGAEETVAAGQLRAGDLVWVGPDGWQPATSAEIGPIPPEPGGWQVLARTRTGNHTATAHRIWRWDDLLQIRRPVPAGGETTRFAAGDTAPTGPSAETHDPRASREAGAEIRDSAPAGTAQAAAGVDTEPADGADTARPHGAGDAAPASAPSSTSLDGGAEVTPAEDGLTPADVARLRAVFEWARAGLARHPRNAAGRGKPATLGMEYAPGEPTPPLHPEMARSGQVAHVEVCWEAGQVDVVYRSDRYELDRIDFCPATVAQGVDLLCAWGVLPARFSQQYAAGVQAGMRRGAAIDGALIEEDADA